MCIMLLFIVFHTHLLPIFYLDIFVITRTFITPKKKKNKNIAPFFCLKCFFIFFNPSPLSLSLSIYYISYVLLKIIILIFDCTLIIFIYFNFVNMQLIDLKIIHNLYL